MIFGPQIGTGCSKLKVTDDSTSPTNSRFIGAPSERVCSRDKTIKRGETHGDGARGTKHPGGCDTLTS